ncbi:nucleotidyltransferase domain-containing protein [Porifericola rhodea]|uniref:nucleotidyltransferase domain-containing protein n=1 Tax=Porifericola rhodea TaxID=930972 RepID=UPI0026667593|nr:nucleotidyltransferase domain-containing protein [Porifericola rhodea]WKN33792.1 nucleotidyltransferase domain-containing protein [Porifericola rhodea]
MTIEEMKERGLLLLECISGSKAYGLATAESDTDIRGVFYLSKEQFYGMNYIPQLSNESNDIVYYELGKFIELLAKNNPNILELLKTPEDCILYKHPLMEQIREEIFLSRLCQQTFGNYAMTQVKKARGLNKKILNPVEKERKSVLDFCYVVQGQGSVPVKDFLTKHQMKQEDCGLSSIAHMREVYGLYHDPKQSYKGIVQSEKANDISLSSIPKEARPVAIMSFNKSGYSSYCRDYREYWEWVEKRNDARYQNTLSHGKNYDAKNMMHTFRLLAMAEEIGKEGTVRVRRPERDFLLNIKKGAFDYEALVEQAEQRINEIEEIYQQSPLPVAPDLKKVEALLVRMRRELY